MNKLAIITINYNNATGLSKTIESIRNQTFRDFEFIVIDGGSTDKSATVIAHNNDIIHYSVSEKDGGVYDAMNKGIVAASGEYCLFLNSGDSLYDEKVLMDSLSLSATDDIIYGNSFKMKPHHRRLIQYPSNFTLYDFFKTEPCIHHQAAFIKRKLFSDFGYYRTDLKVNADWEFFFRVILLKGVKTTYIDRVICTFDAGGLSNTLKSDNPFRKEVQDKKKEILKLHYPEYILSDYRALDKLVSRRSFFKKLWDKWSHFSFKR